MLAAVGVENIDELFCDIRPENRPRSFAVAKGRSEYEIVSYFRELARRNASDLTLFIGGGYYDHYVPAAVTSLISRGEFLTAYTPYQPECSQGTLQALYEYQSAICALTGMDAANASLYDGGTALYEAMMMAVRVTRRNKVILDGGVSPIYRKIIRSYTRNLNIAFAETAPLHGQSDRAAMAGLLDDQTAAVIVQNPNFFGALDDHSDLAEEAHRKGALVIQSVYPVAQTVLKTPAEMGVDIVTGEGQSLGLPLSFGGPYLGFMATRRSYIRKMPGRIVGRTIDAFGRTCFVNTLQAREQHIRREKATSNICTNVALCAVQSMIFMSLLGRKGLRDLALRCRQKAVFLQGLLSAVEGVEVKNSAPVFNEFTIKLPVSADAVVRAMAGRGYAAGFPLAGYYPGMEDYMTIAVTEKRTRSDMEGYARALADTLKELSG